MFPNRGKMNDKVEEVKAHIRTHRQKYIFAGSCVLSAAAGAGAMKVLGAEQIAIVDSIKLTLLSWKSPTTNTITQLLVRRGHPGNVVQCLETGEVFASQNAAAVSMGLNPGEVSKQVRGLIPDVRGHTFMMLGEAIAPSQNLQGL
jgi:hypothetical protein